MEHLEICCYRYRPGIHREMHITGWDSTRVCTASEVKKHRTAREKIKRCGVFASIENGVRVLVHKKLVDDVPFPHISATNDKEMVFGETQVTYTCEKELQQVMMHSYNIDRRCSLTRRCGRLVSVFE